MSKQHELQMEWCSATGHTLWIFLLILVVKVVAHVHFLWNKNIRVDDAEKTPLVEAIHFCHLIGSLLYLQVTRPDITLTVNTLSQFVSTPRQLHFDAALRILRYLKATLRQGIFCLPPGILL